ncbi:MAG: alginate lyase family protein [Planctomycetota bacterium]|nr:alginate lyase family protein [Planctomycetota bacterium]
MLSIPRDVCEILCDAIDWDRPELAPAAALRRAGDAPAAAAAFVRHLRSRETPRLGYTAAYMANLRQAATPERREAIVKSWNRVLEGDLHTYHGNALNNMGAEAFLIAATPDLCERTARKILDYRPRWAEGLWGTVHSICDVLSYLWPVKECDDALLIPAFAWLAARWPVEWADARGWDERDLGTEGHNWWAHTLHGFFKLGLFFPELRGAAGFQAFAADYLQREAEVLFEDDGWSKEGSPGYHSFAADNLIRIAHLMALNGLPVPEATHRKLTTIADASWRMLLPDGDYPAFGDHVRGNLYSGFKGPGRPANGTCHEIRRRAARFGLSHAKFVAEALDPGAVAPAGSTLADSGEEMLEAYRRLPAASPGSPDTSLRQSGLYVMRQDWTPDADAAAIVAGKMGPRITSHKQADLLSFELYARGRRVLVDNFYGSGAEDRADDRVRMWRVSSPAHNLATVDGEDCVKVVREFLYGSTVVPTVDDFRSDAKFAYFSAVHEGYLRLPKPIHAYRRKMFYLRGGKDEAGNERGGYWILIDRFTSFRDEEHDYQLHFHLATPSRLLEAGRVTTLPDKPGTEMPTAPPGSAAANANLLIVPVPGADGERTIEPNPLPLKGYENPDHLRYTRHGRGHHRFITLLVPYAGAALPQVSVEELPVECDGRTLSNFEATALSITIDGRKDFYFDQHMQWNLPWSSGGFQGRGRLFHSAGGVLTVG